MSLRSRVLASGIPEALELLPEGQVKVLLHEAVRQAERTRLGFLWEVRNVFKDRGEAMVGFGDLVDQWVAEGHDLSSVKGPLMPVIELAMSGFPQYAEMSERISEIFIEEVLVYHPVWGLRLNRVVDPWGSSHLKGESGWGVKRWYRVRHHLQHRNLTDVLAEVEVFVQGDQWFIQSRALGQSTLTEMGSVPKVYTAQQRLQWFQHPSVRGSVMLAVRVEVDENDRRLVAEGYTLRP